MFIPFILQTVAGIIAGLITALIVRRIERHR